MQPTTPSEYEASAEAYATCVAWREQGGVDGDPFGILSPLLNLLGDAGRRKMAPP